MNALADPEVGDYINKHFRSTFFKVGTFTLVNGNVKQGGNVASYFCLGDGRVLHAVAGPVDAATLLREARWAVDAYKHAWLETRGESAALGQFMQEVHAERLIAEHHFNPWKRQSNRPAYYIITPNSRRERSRDDWARQERIEPEKQFSCTLQTWHRLNNRGKVHALLGRKPLAQIDGVYKKVFEEILLQKVTSLPVQER